MKRRIFLVAVLLLPLVSCAPPPEPEFTSADKAAIVAEIEGIVSELNARAAQGDFEGFMSRFTANPELYFVGEPGLFVQGMQLIPDKPAMDQFFSSMLESRNAQRNTLLDSRIAVLSPNHALQYARHTYSIVNSEGVEGPTYPLASTTMWVKEEGVWKIVHYNHTWSTTPVDETGS